ncbi:putative ternary complex factor MIP1 [Tanacetum coccineum]|uniref:Ternary complex factor MIP1 n=2 Tax=Tanacetum TaxID=99105 RepID=A0ABQ5BIX3_9ASTR
MGMHSKQFTAAVVSALFLFFAFAMLHLAFFIFAAMLFCCFACYFVRASSCTFSFISLRNFHPIAIVKKGFCFKPSTKTKDSGEVQSCLSEHKFNPKKEQVTPIKMFDNNPDFHTTLSLFTTDPEHYHIAPHAAQIPPTVSQATNSALSKTKKQISGHQKKEELEREVLTLQKMLDHEEKVGEILKRTYERQDHAALHIPNSLPPKMKELLTELAMVENEITRLESQISHLQTDLDKEKEATKESKTKQGQFCLIPNASLAPTTPLLSPKTRGYGDKLSFETKALHFISKAIKGDYSLRDFNSHDKTKTKTVSFSEQKENYANDEDFGARSRTPRRTGILKPPSPARERHVTPKRERNIGMSSESGPNQSEEDNIIKWSPNKLSENIMKCLIFIFTRLLRTSRTMEIEKSGPISRSTNFSMSFRAEPCLNSKASLLLQKESRQQDPYGIFNQEDSIPRDIGCYKNLVKFTSTSLDPKCISSSSYIPLLQKLRAYMNGLQKVDLLFLTSQQKLAFWINMYNACIMHGFLQYGVPSSPEKLMTLMSKATLKIGGNTINAQAIEHVILRRQEASVIEKIYGKSEKDDKEAIFRKHHGLESMDPNITFALCCGTRSSPAVRVYTSDGVVNELERAKLEYLQASIIVTSGKKIGLPELLLRNMNDFAPDLERLVEWLCQQLPTSGTLRKSMVDCFRVNNAKVTSIVEKLPYEFEFQYLLPM